MKKFSVKELDMIKKAVHLAESKTSGEIVPFVTDRAGGGLYRFFLIFLAKLKKIPVTRLYAIYIFNHLKMDKTKERTGILLALFLKEKKVEVIADRGIHKKCGNKIWQGVVEIIVRGAKQGKIAEGFCAGIKRCGEILTKHFPAKKRNPNELKDDLVVG